MRRQLSSLRIRLWTLGLLAAVPAFLMMQYAASEGREMAVAQAQSEALRLARLVSADQAPLFEGGRELLTTLAQLPEVRGGDPAPCSALLGTVLKQHPRYANLGVVNPQGDVICSAISAQDPVNYADASWFKRAVAERDLAICDYMIGRITGKPVLHLGYPSFDDSGQLQVLVYASLDLSWLNRAVAEGQWPSQTSIAIVDRHGTLLARYPEAEQGAGQSFPTMLAETILAEREGVTQAATPTGDFLYAFAPLGKAAAVDAHVVIAIPSATALSGVNQLVSRNLMALLLATGLTLLAAWLGTDLLVLRPVRTLARVTQRLESGDLGARVDFTGLPGELGQLGGAFDEMAQALQLRAEQREQLEQAAREQNEFFETVIQSLAHPFYVIAAHDYSILLANAAAGRELVPGVSTCYERVHGNPRPCSELGTACPLEEARRTGKPATAIHTHHDSLGNPRQVQVYATPLLDADHHVSRVIEYYLDITERTKAEEALASANERLAITLTSIGDGIIATDLDERIVLLNPAAEQLTGWSRADAIGAPLLDVFRIVNAKTRQPLPDPARQALERQQVQGLWPDTVLMTKDGAERFVSSTISPVRNRAGQITGVVLVLRDITRLKQAEEALKESQEYTRSLIDSSLDMIIAVDRHRRITEFNRAARETLGYELDEVIGREVDILYANPEENAAVYQEVAETGRCAREVLSRRKDGRVFPCYLSASSLRNASGETIGHMGISRDITRLKQAEEQNVRSERLAALGRMAAALAHEINNPLQAIQSTLDLVLDFALDPREREEALHNVRQEIERLSAINQRILQFARPAQGTRRVMPLSALVRQTLALAGKHLQRAQVRVTTDLSDDLLVPAVPEQLVQVILNLVLNAIEAAGEGGHLHISSRAEGDQAALSFTNDGPGIPPEVMGHIFEPFFTTKPDGSGLGLSVTANIVQQHGGTVRVENLDRRGVVFTVRLPRVWSNQE